MRRGGRPALRDAVDSRPLVVPDRGELEDELAGLFGVSVAAGARRRAGLGRERLERADVGGSLATGVERAGSRLRHAGERLRWSHPGPLLKRAGAGSRSCDWRRPIWPPVVSSSGQRLEGLARHARSLSPQHVIERGFAVVRRRDGTVVRDPGQVQEGEMVEISVAHAG